MTESIQTENSFEAFGNTYHLQRYPDQKSNALRAWDAADHYLLDTLLALKTDLSGICIINDNFGALTLPLLKFNPLVYSDSWLSREAIYTNIERNRLNKSLNFLPLIEALSQHTPPAPVIIGRIPKSKKQLAFLLTHLHRWANDGSRLLLSGMDKHLSKGQFDLLAQYFGPSKFYPGRKKARVWEAILDKKLDQGSSPLALKPNTLTLEAFDLSLVSGANVFSHDKLDIGTRFFLDNIHKLPHAKHVADLACGNGVLGLSYLRRHGDASMTFSDESFQAIEACKINWQHNLSDAQVTLRADDGFKHSKASAFDLILCNPPFHHQHIVGTDMAFSLFKDALRSLKKGGEFWVIANRHLGYHVRLKNLFGHCTTEASNSKFVLLKAVK